MESVFRNVDLNDARNENENYEDYKVRRKKNKLLLKMYKKHGRGLFEQAFPDGVTYGDLDTKLVPTQEQTFVPADVVEETNNEPVNFDLDEQTEKRIFGESK